MEDLVKRWIATILRATSTGNGSARVDEETIGRVKCRGCDSLILPIRNKVYCSGLCYQRHHRLIKRKVHEPVICTVCSKSFIPTKVNSLRCSEVCRTIHTRQYHAHRYEEFRKRRITREIERKPCRSCGITFEVTRPNRVYCSVACKREFRYIKARKHLFDWTPSLREVTDQDIQSSEFSEQIKAYKKSGKKIITFPAITPSSHDVHIDGVGVDNETLQEELSNFNKRREKND